MTGSSGLVRRFALVFYADDEQLSLKGSGHQTARVRFRLIRRHRKPAGPKVGASPRRPSLDTNTKEKKWWVSFLEVDFYVLICRSKKK